VVSKKTKATDIQVKPKVSAICILNILHIRLAIAIPTIGIVTVFWEDCYCIKIFLSSYVFINSDFNLASFFDMMKDFIK